MFQNINEDTIDFKDREKRNNKRNINIFSNVFTKNNILLYIVSLMVSLVGLGGEFSIFSISILGACFASSIPALGIIIVSLIGNLVRFGLEGAVGYFFTAIALIISLFIFKPRYNEQERNEKIKIGKNIFIATLVVQLTNVMKSGFTVYDFLLGITISIIALVFYKIFVNSIVVLQDFYKKRAFSIEEVVGASLLLSIAVGAFGKIDIFGINLTNVLSILIVMVLGWKNGILVGTTSGVTIGVTLGTILGTEPIMIAAYAISGMIAGLLSRFGKIGVIIGFVLGNIVLAYVANGYTVELIHFKEILIASIGLLAIPKSFSINLEEFIGNSKFLPDIPSRALNNSKQVVEDLNNVSEAIEEMASTYRSVNQKNSEENADICTNRQVFITELLNNLEPYKENMLYDDIADVNGRIIEEIFKMLLDKQEISREDLLQIFANCNSYIIGFEDKDISKKLEDNISQILRIINVSYKVSKSDFIWQKKVEENNKNAGKQLKDVSKAIKDMAKGIENDIKVEEKYIEERKNILEILKQKDIEVEDIVINKNERFIVDIYLKDTLETEKLDVIEKVLTDILKEKIVLNTEATIGKKLNYMSDDIYKMSLGTSVATKSKSEASGDTMLNIRLKDGKYLVAISDGMGSGNKAKNSSTKALRLLENLLQSGFDKNVSLDLINNALINQQEEIFATLDIAIIDLYKGKIEYIKSGACPTYIKNKKRVQMIKSSSLPTGIVEDTKIQVFDRDIVTGDIMLMCSDGILDSNVEYKNKELWIKYMLEDIETINTQKIADLVLNEAIDNSFGMAKDDMSVMVCKFVKK